MPLAVFFWVVFILWMIVRYPGATWGPYGAYGGYLLLIVLIATLGYGVFGGMIH